MGDLQSKPMQNQELRYLEQQYEPFSKGKHIPGEPTYLKLNSIFQKSEYCDKNHNRFKKIQRYQLSKSYTQRSLQEDRSIYDYRRTNLPCIVQIVYFCIEKEECECSNNAHRVVLYTQHVQTRLAHYKTTKKVQNNQLQSIQYYHSFTLDEGIFVLINALHAYQLLSQQFMVNYPSPFSIGINFKAQIKVWINDNWSINDQNHRKLSQNLIIEEIINIIQERMEGNFNHVLNVTANYMNFTFSSIQEILSKFTINYQKGKKSLEDRLNNRSFLKDGDKSNIFSQKIPLGKQRPNSIHTISNLTNNIVPSANPSIAQEDKKASQARPIIEKRHFSQQTCKDTNQLTIPNSVRNYSITPTRTSVEDSPKKVIKFTYQQSPKISTPQRNSSPVSPYNESFRQPPPIYSYVISSQQDKIPFVDMNVRKNGTNRPLIMPANVTNHFLDKQTISNLIDKKLKAPTQQSIKEPTSSKVVSTGYKRQANNFSKTLQYSFDKNPKYFDPQPNEVTIKPFQVFSKEERKMQFASNNDQKLKKANSIQLNVTTENASLTEITEQFKNLLKSDHKIEERQELFFNYEEDQGIEDDDEEYKESRKTVEETNDNNPYVHSFYEIKEEDEDISYSVDQLI